MIMQVLKILRYVALREKIQWQEVPLKLIVFPLSLHNSRHFPNFRSNFSRFLRFFEGKQNLINLNLFTSVIFISGGMLRHFQVKR